jgi:hypothetical protein
MNPFNNNKNKTTSSDRIAKLKAATIIKNTPLSKKYNSYNQKINYTNNALNQTCDKTCTYDISKNIFQGKNNIYNKFKDFSNPSCNNNIETYTNSVIKNLNNKNIHAGNAKGTIIVENLIKNSKTTPSESAKNKQSDPAVMEILDLMTRQPNKFVPVKSPIDPTQNKYVYDNSHVILYFDLSKNYNPIFTNNALVTFPNATISRYSSSGGSLTTKITPSFELIRPGPNIEFVRIDISNTSSTGSTGPTSKDLYWITAKHSSESYVKTEKNNRNIYFIHYSISGENYNIQLGIPSTVLSNGTYDVSIAGWNSWAIKPPADNSGVDQWKLFSGSNTHQALQIGDKSKITWKNITEEKGRPFIVSARFSSSLSTIDTISLIINVSDFNFPGVDYSHLTLSKAQFNCTNIINNKIGLNVSSSSSFTKSISQSQRNTNFTLSFDKNDASFLQQPGSIFNLSVALKNNLTDSLFSDPKDIKEVYTLLPDSSPSKPPTIGDLFKPNSSAIGSSRFRKVNGSLQPNSYYINNNNQLSFETQNVEFEITDPCNNPVENKHYGRLVTSPPSGLAKLSVTTTTPHSSTSSVTRNSTFQYNSVTNTQLDAPNNTHLITDISSVDDIDPNKGFRLRGKFTLKNITTTTVLTDTTSKIEYKLESLINTTGKFFNSTNPTQAITKTITIYSDNPIGTPSHEPIELKSAVSTMTPITFLYNCGLKSVKEFNYQFPDIQLKNICSNLGFVPNDYSAKITPEPPLASTHTDVSSQFILTQTDFNNSGDYTWRDASFNNAKLHFTGEFITPFDDVSVSISLFKLEVKNLNSSVYPDIQFTPGSYPSTDPATNNIFENYNICDYHSFTKDSNGIITETNAPTFFQVNGTSSIRPPTPSSTPYKPQITLANLIEYKKAPSPHIKVLEKQTPLFFQGKFITYQDDNSTEKNFYDYYNKRAKTPRTINSSSDYYINHIDSDTTSKCQAIAFKVEETDPIQAPGKDTTTIPKISFTYTHGTKTTDVSFQDFLTDPDNHSQLTDHLHSYIFRSSVENYGIVYFYEVNKQDNNVFISSNPWYEATDDSFLGTLSGNKKNIINGIDDNSYILILIKENFNKIKIQYNS